MSVGIATWVLYGMLDKGNRRYKEAWMGSRPCFERQAYMQKCCRAWLMSLVSHNYTLEGVPFSM